MLRHQHLFNAMNQRIDSGIDILDGYNASLESFNQAVDILGRLEAGDTTAVIDAQARFGHETITETVSNEAVVYHVNSAQIQAVIDFVKKYLPILLRKLREYAKQFLDWLKVASKRLESRLDALKEKIKRSTQKEFAITSGSRAVQRYALALLEKGQFNFGTKDALESIIDASWAMLNVADRKTGEAATGAVHAYMKGVREWVGKGEHINGMHATFPSADDYNAAMRQINALDSTEQVFQQLVDKVVSRGGRKSLAWTKSEIDNAHRKIAQAVVALSNAVDETRKLIDQVRKHAEELEGKVNKGGHQESILWTKFSLQGIAKCENAVTVGYQKNIGVAGECITLLERALNNEVETQ